MSNANLEKRIGSIPSSLKPNTLYFVNNNGTLEIYATDAAGKHAITTANGGGSSNDVVITLVTTDKIPIIDNRIQLPSKPEGGVAFDIMFVYDENNVATVYHSVSIQIEYGLFYAKLANLEPIQGHGVVCYNVRT